MVVNYYEELCVLKRSKGINSLRAGTKNIRSGRFINIGKVKRQQAGVPGCILTPAANSKPPWKVPASCKPKPAKIIFNWTCVSLFQALGKHLEDEDVEAFTNEVKNYDTISRLDQWYTTMLLRIKKQIPDDGELC